jgi:tRNA-dihydrouridine synthase C
LVTTADNLSFAEFIRVPRSSDHPAATTRGICSAYDACELGDVPLAAQLMGSNTQLLAAAAERLVHVKGAPRIDLNCGGCTWHFVSCLHVQ